MFTKGAKKTLQTQDSDWSDGKSAWISVVVAICLALLTFAVLPLIKRRIDASPDKRQLPVSSEQQQQDAGASHKQGE